LPSTASKAVRCQSTVVCQSAASPTSSHLAAIDAGKLDAKATIDAAALKAAGVIRRPKDGVRILADGELKTKVSFEVAGASKPAVEKIEKSGGSIKLLVVAAEAAE
jgi:large subunit ribosomal protein L15